MLVCFLFGIEYWMNFRKYLKRARKARERALAEYIFPPPEAHSMNSFGQDLPWTREEAQKYFDGFFGKLICFEGEEEPVLLLQVFVGNGGWSNLKYLKGGRVQERDFRHKVFPNYFRIKKYR